jgi:hypothetical protein
MIFGKAAWAMYFGDIGVEPPLPSNIQAILQSPCPFWGKEGKKVQDTHLLVLIPQMINGRPFTLKYLEELIQKPLLGFPIKFRGFDMGECYNPNTQVQSSYWVLMTKEIIPESSGNGDNSAQERVSQKVGYRFPGILEAATCILMENIRTRNSYRPWFGTSCEEMWNGRYHLMVGNFLGEGGPIISYGGGYFAFCGVNALRKL